MYFGFTGIRQYFILGVISFEVKKWAESINNRNKWLQLISMMV